jgi:YbbR domain-containing protein
MKPGEYAGPLDPITTTSSREVSLSIPQQTTLASPSTITSHISLSKHPLQKQPQEQENLKLTLSALLSSSFRELQHQSQISTQSSETFIRKRKLDDAIERAGQSIEKSTATQDPFLHIYMLAQRIERST